MGTLIFFGSLAVLAILGFFVANGSSKHNVPHHVDTEDLDK